MRDGVAAFRILDSVEVRIDSRVIKVAAPRQRALLAQLLLNANRTVGTPELIEGIWGTRPPQHPASALQIIVCRLRQALDVLAPRLVRDPAGYRIDIDADELDLSRAETYAGAAHQAMRDGDAARAAASLDAALACFTGRPLADLANFPFYDEVSRHVREFQLGLVELRNSAYLRCGRHLDVLEDIESWIRNEPWRERLRAHQMVALYRTGRQIEALAVYKELRRLLIDEFGVEPCDDLKRLHGRILQGDPTLLENRSDGNRALDGLVSRLREVALAPTEVFRVDGGPGVRKAWLVAEIPLDSADTLRRVNLDDWLANAPSWLADAVSPRH